MATHSTDPIFRVYLAGLGETIRDVRSVEAISSSYAAETAAEEFVQDNMEWADRFPIKVVVIDADNHELVFMVDLDWTPRAEATPIQ